VGSIRSMPSFREGTWSSWVFLGLSRKRVASSFSIGPQPISSNARPRLRRQLHPLNRKTATPDAAFALCATGRGVAAFGNQQSSIRDGRPAAQRVGRAQFDGFHYRRDAQTMRQKQDGIPHNRTSPGRNTQAVSRNLCRKRTVSSDRAKTAKQGSADFVFFEVCHLGPTARES
jgi:hypothetical protein